MNVTLKTHFVLSGSEVGGRPVLGVSGVRPSALEQSASEAAGLQLGEGTCYRKTYFYDTIKSKFYKKNTWYLTCT